MRKSFLLHLDSLCILEELDDVQKGQLFNAIYKYQLGQEIELTPLVKIAFSQFKNQFQRDNEKYQNVCEVRKQAGSIGGKSFYKKDSGIDNEGIMQLYIIRLFNDDEDFIKIGITSDKLNRRFSGMKNMPYNYEVIKQVIDQKNAIELESYFHNKLFNFKYLPKISFPGYLECFTKNSLPEILNDDLFAQAKLTKIKQDEANQADNKNKNKNKNKSDSDNVKDNEDIKKEFSFSLSKDTHYSNLSEEYKYKLKAKCLLIDGDFKRYEDFILSLESKASYKYKDFTLTYRSWDKEKKYKAYTPEPEPMLGDDWYRVGLGGGKYIAINSKTYEMKSGEASVHENQNIEPLQENKKRDMNNLIKGTFNEI